MHNDMDEDSYVSPSKVLTKVIDAGLHGHKTLSKKTLTKFLMENFDRVKGALQ
jgi:hypothetical protein